MHTVKFQKTLAVLKFHGVTGDTQLSGNSQEMPFPKRQVRSDLGEFLPSEPTTNVCCIIPKTRKLSDPRLRWTGAKFQMRWSNARTKQQSTKEKISKKGIKRSNINLNFLYSPVLKTKFRDAAIFPFLGGNRNPNDIFAQN